MCIRDRIVPTPAERGGTEALAGALKQKAVREVASTEAQIPVSYTHLRAHETVLDLVCRLLLEKKTTRQHKRLYASTARMDENSAK